MDITKLSLTELKALAYDLLVKAQTAQGDLNLVNQEIAKKKEEPKKK
jgi:hypothetical protein